MLTLREATLSRGTKILLEKANLHLQEKQKIGLIGLNGCGKSSFFSLMRNEMTTDHGECDINTTLRISHLAQEIPDTNEPAIDFVLRGDIAYTILMRQLKDAEKSGDDIGIMTCHNTLHHTGGYAKPALAAVIMAGLGFTAEQQQLPVNDFSGGWRMRLNLAKCLIQPADLLLLDEPTNHLDMEAIFWLENWLKLTPASLLIISHDRDFLDGIVSHILHIDNKSIKLYTGNYTTFEKTRAMQLALQQATYEKQQGKISHMMDFVNRFKAKASKAKQAQSRLKMIDKIEQVAQAQIDSPFTFEFYPCPKAGYSLVQCEAVQAGYSPDKAILKNINLIIKPGDRIALLGPNGQGKSTLIKTLTNIIPPLQGTIQYSAHLNIGYYAQHQLEDLDCEASPLETLQRLNPQAREQDIRNYLGGFDFHGDMAINPIRHFSGGEKARLALAKLVWLKPNLLLLDEPTNHLDLGMRSALEIALQSYEGAVVIISHDRHLLKSTVDEYFLIFDGKVASFHGDLDEYHHWLQNKNIEESLPKKDKATIQYKEKKALQNKLKSLEQKMESLHAELKKLDLLLADGNLYEASQSDTLKQLTDKKSCLEKTLQETESSWMEISITLEE